MQIKNILEKCAEHGHPMTRMGIYVAGKKYGFINKKEGSFYYDFDKDKFIEWLSAADKIIPEHYLKVKELSEKYKIDVGKVYRLIYKFKIKTQNYGIGKGHIYVNEIEFENAIKEYKSEHTIDWGDF